MHQLALAGMHDKQHQLQARRLFYRYRNDQGGEEGFYKFLPANTADRLKQRNGLDHIIPDSCYDIEPAAS